MKKFVLISISVLFAVSCSRLQVVPEPERSIREVFAIAMDKDKIYDNTLEWMAKKFSSSKDEIVVRDKIKGRLIAKGMNHYYEYFSFIVERPFTFTMTVDVKDNKYRVVYDSFNVLYNENTYSMSPAQYRREVDLIKEKLDGYSRDLRAYLAAELKASETKQEEKQDEW